MGAFEADFLHFVSMSVAKIWNSQLLAAATEALERSELREVFFESETQLWCATEE